MSLQENIMKIVNKDVTSFLEDIANKYDLDANLLCSDWASRSRCKQEIKTQNKQTKTKQPLSMPKASDTLDPTFLLSCTKPDLVALCKDRQIPHSGKNKSELLNLLNGQKNTNDKQDKKTKPAKQTTIKTTKKDNTPPVAKALIEQSQHIPIRRNQFGNHEHPETSLVFNRETKVVIGKQNDNGDIDELTADDIDNCNKFKFEYVMPSNLDKKTSLKDVDIEELSDEEEDIEDEDEEIIEDEDEEIIEEIPEDDEILDEDDFLDEDINESDEEGYVVDLDED